MYLRGETQQLVLKALLNINQIAFVWSKLEYANIVWDNCSNQLSDLLESVQYRAAKIISGAIHRTSHNIVYDDRRKKQIKQGGITLVSGDKIYYMLD